MAKKFSQLKAAAEVAVEIDPERRARRQEYRRAITDALALGKLREARGETQQHVADTMGASQANISRIERQQDLYLSTLGSYVEALGGYLEVAAIFPDQRIVLIDTRSAMELERDDVRSHGEVPVGGAPPSTSQS